MSKHSTNGYDGGPTVRHRMLDMLVDGYPHTVQELATLLYDELSAGTAVKKHICLLRKELRPMGYDILFAQDGQTKTYRIVRTLASAYDGRR